jgi:Putative MetA-pathway of phenol degradation
MLAAQAGKPPMPTMDTTATRPKKPDMKNMSKMTNMRNMRDLMRAPLPFGIMIGRGERWMVGYQYMFEKLNGMLEGTDAVSNADVLKRFDTAPTDMTMRTHMGMIMYTPSDRSTVMAMLPYIEMSMGELHRDGTRSTERSQGVGDLELRGLYSLYSAKDLRHRFLANFGIGFPTGSVNHVDAEGARLEYPMQTGSGTYSLEPGVMYLGQVLPWSWGAEFNSTVRLGRNEHGYRQGNRYEPGIWVSRQVASWVNLSTGANGEFWENIHGSDSVLDPADEPTKDANLQGVKRLNASVGITINPAIGFFKSQQFLVQGDVPLMQSLDGPQLKRSYMLHFAWQWAW